MVSPAAVRPDESLQPSLHPLDRELPVRVREVDGPEHNLLVGDAALEERVRDRDGHLLRDPCLEHRHGSREATHFREERTDPFVARQGVVAAQRFVLGRVVGGDTVLDRALECAVARSLPLQLLGDVARDQSHRHVRQADPVLSEPHQTKNWPAARGLACAPPRPNEQSTPPPPPRVRPWPALPPQPRRSEPPPRPSAAPVTMLRQRHRPPLRVDRRGAVSHAVRRASRGRREIGSPVAASRRPLRCRALWLAASRACPPQPAAARAPQPAAHLRDVHVDGGVLATRRAHHEHAVSRHPTP